MKNLKKVLSILLAVVMTLSLAACEGSSGKIGFPKRRPSSKLPELPSSELSHDERSSAIYEAQLGEFKEFYDKAKEAKTISERFALMAIAEAKLLESAVLLPSSTQGGNYRMGRTARRSGSTVFWGYDADRQHSIIVTDKIIKTEDNEHLLDMWYELKGTGTYSAKAIEYLESKGYKLKDTLTQLYSDEPETYDVLATSKQPDTAPIVNTFDGLVEYDNENTMRPALAESWEISEDGLTYTFHIREGVEWVDAQGTKVADLKADDFVAGMQHMLETGGGLESLVFPIIVNAQKFVEGEISDFAEVGVKALDDHTLEYKLIEPTTYFMTMLNYGIFAPMSREYYLSKGGKFGADELQQAIEDHSCTYGTSHETIAYCGPYRITNHIDKNTFVFEENPSYWNKDNVQCKKIVWSYYDGKDETRPYNDTKSGAIDGCGLVRSNLESAKKDIDSETGKTYFESYATIADTTGATFANFINLDRVAYANFNDETKGVSAMTDEQKNVTNHAVYNVHFRRAIGMALDTAAYNGVVVGEELKLARLRNSYTPGTFVSLDEETKVKINGKDKTYPAGTFFGEIVQDQIDADGVKIKVWDREKNTSDGFSGWHSPENAMEELNIAIKELKKQGIKNISKENPIHCEIPCEVSNPTMSARTHALKQSIEESLQGFVIVDLLEFQSHPDYMAAGFATQTGDQANYTFFDGSGWGPDYGDPQTYLDTMLPDHDGYMTKVAGLW